MVPTLWSQVFLGKAPRKIKQIFRIVFQDSLLLGLGFPGLSTETKTKVIQVMILGAGPIVLYFEILRCILVRCP
jgi:hypothetical protein